MKKLIALYTVPEDIDAFFARYTAGHLPLVHKIPGLLGAEITRIDRTLVGGEGNFLLVEMKFADANSFKTAMKSPEMGAASGDVGEFAANRVTVMTGETLDL
ncbi:EthD family reductase [Brevundimonas sp.]|uniref:EthD family reductase n=1 Tax=Brevundimonas sp. TaxID=1871086 RepID=UPI003B00A8C1